LGIVSSTTLAIFLDDFMGRSFLFRYSVILSHFPYIILPLVGVKAVEPFRWILLRSFIVLLLIIIDVVIRVNKYWKRSYRNKSILRLESIFKDFYIRFGATISNRTLLSDKDKEFYDHSKITFCNSSKKYDDIIFVI
jgi:hypothetical protein